jgi:hypothetical protein
MATTMSGRTFTESSLRGGRDKFRLDDVDALSGASDESRSLNSQIEYLLMEAARKSGRWQNSLDRAHGHDETAGDGWACLPTTSPLPRPS